MGETRSLKDRWQSITNALFEKQDGASLAVFRIVLGVLLMRDFLHGFPYIKRGAQYSFTDFKASFHGFEWVQSNPVLIEFFVYMLPIGALFIIFGLFYRFVMPITTIIVMYFFIIAPENYLNHYYMLLLYLGLMSFMPANRVWSIDSYIRTRIGKNKKARDDTVLGWCYWALKLQTEVILIFAGLVKINPDWLQLQPLGTWIRPDLLDIPYVGWLFFFDAPIALGAYGVIALHIIGAPLLLKRTTRPWVFALYVCFHAANAQLFHIGIFPYMTIAATLLFFDPDWPRRIINKVRRSTGRKLYIGEGTKCSYPYRIVITSFVSVWLFVQILVPMMALWHTNLETAWKGHLDNFTWRMMLNDKAVYTASFVVDMPEINKVAFVPAENYLSKRQCFRITTMPNMAIQYTQYLKRAYQREFQTENVSVHAYIKMSVNYREPEIWADPTVDLASKQPIWDPHEWIMPVTKSLRSWRQYVRSPKYIPPTYGEILTEMNIPSDRDIVFNKEDVDIQSAAVVPKCG